MEARPDKATAGRLGRALFGATRLAVVLMVGLNLAGCSTWQVPPAPPLDVLAVADERVVRVTRTDRSTVVLGTPTVVRDTVLATARGRRIQVPMEEVAGVEVRRFDGGRTFLAVLSVPAAALFILFNLASID